MSVASPIALPRRRPLRLGKRLRFRRAGLHALLLSVAVVWLFPLAWAVYTSFRPYADTAARGYVSLPGALTLDNYAAAWRDGELLGHFVNTVLIVAPAVAIVLALALAAALVMARFSWRFNVALLVLFTTASLLPPHALIAPLWRLYLFVPLFDEIAGIVLIHVAFQVGFATFVLSAYIKSIPSEVLEAARLDGASIPRLLRSVVAPLARPALAALAVLETTWIYNDFLWALVLMQTTAKRPVTSALANLSGEFFTDHNVVAAAAVLIALPTVVVFLVARRHLKRGLTLGSTSG